MIAHILALFVRYVPCFVQVVLFEKQHFRREDTGPSPPPGCP